MIVVDTSAVAAVFLGEPESERCIAAILDAAEVLLPAPAYVECSMVLGGRGGPAGLEKLEKFVLTQNIQIVPLTAEHARAAQAAFMAFGKGRHRAGLNFGDCMSYAVAKVEGLPLLYVGEDFAATDVVGA